MRARSTYVCLGVGQIVEVPRLTSRYYIFRRQSPTPSTITLRTFCGDFLGGTVYRLLVPQGELNIYRQPVVGINSQLIESLTLGK